MKKLLNRICQWVYLPLIWVFDKPAVKGFGGPVAGGGWFQLVRFRNTNIFVGYYQPVQKWFTKRPR